MLVLLWNYKEVKENKQIADKSWLLDELLGTYVSSLLILPMWYIFFYT